MSSKQHDDAGAEDEDIFADCEEPDVPSADDPGWSWNDDEEQEEGTEAENEGSADTNDRSRAETRSGTSTRTDSSLAGSNVVSPANVPTEAVEKIRAEEEALSALAASELPAGDIAAELLAIIERKDRFD